MKKFLSNNWIILLIIGVALYLYSKYKVKQTTADFSKGFWAGMSDAFSNIGKALGF